MGLIGIELGFDKIREVGFIDREHPVDGALEFLLAVAVVARGT
jgi:hypothetical protein